MIYAKIQSFSEDETEITLEREDEKVFTLKISQLTDFDALQAKKTDREKEVIRKRKMIPAIISAMQSSIHYGRRF